MSCNDLCTQEECISDIPSNICLELVKDADTTFTCTLTDGYGNAIDITNDSVVLTVHDYLGGAQKLQKTNLTGEHSDPENGQTQFKIENADIADTLTDERTEWIYEIRRIQSGGDESVHIAGDFIVFLTGGA
jgi:hypothetical protein